MKTKLGNFPFFYPIPIILSGANVEGKANFANLGDAGLMGINPALVYISLHAKHHSTKGVFENQTFSINIPNTKMLEVTDYCGIVSGKDVDKSQLFEVFYGELENAPMIAECPLNMECKVVHVFAIQHRQVFVGEVIQTYLNEEYVTEREGKKIIAGLEELDPILYALNNDYYSIGKPIGKGYQTGKNYGEKQNNE